MTKFPFLSISLSLCLSLSVLASPTSASASALSDVSVPTPVTNATTTTTKKVSLPKTTAKASVSSPVVSPSNKTSASQERLSRLVAQKFGTSSQDAQSIVKVAHEEAQKHGIDPVLVLSIIAAESNFNPRAHSSQGAMGLMQAIPRWHGDKMRRLGVKHHQMYNIRENIVLGTAILREYLHISNGHTSNALQRYNGSLNDRNKRYSKKVMGLYSSFSGN